ncbi:MAG: hypothetical protein RMJ98_08905, partial [Myxococcales bacterium]|nr:hypothetical protein [Polyangiaceae bacterium]MDW8249404.1 hypothetical protein [Myxococcales bacterium]
CILACKCSPGGLYQCAASCEGGASCPEEMPKPGSSCPPDGPKECKFNAGFCLCQNGIWWCAAP